MFQVMHLLLINIELKYLLIEFLYTHFRTTQKNEYTEILERRISASVKKFLTCVNADILITSFSSTAKYKNFLWMTVRDGSYLAIWEFRSQVNWDWAPATTKIDNGHAVYNALEER